LTYLYIFHPAISQTERERLLAARSMVYSKILEKNELDERLKLFCICATSVPALKQYGNCHLRIASICFLSFDGSAQKKRVE